MPGHSEKKRILALNAVPHTVHVVDGRVDLRFCASIAEAAEIAHHWRPSALCILVSQQVTCAVRLLRTCRSLSSLHSVPAIAVVKDWKTECSFLLRNGFVSVIRSPIEMPANSDVLLTIGGIRAVAEDRNLLTYQDIKIDLAEYKVWRGAHRLNISSQQFELLKLLMQNPGRIFSREELIERVWKGRRIDSHTVNTCCVRLRRKLCSQGEANLLHNFHGKGYALDAEYKVAATRV